VAGKTIDDIATLDASQPLVLSLEDRADRIDFIRFWINHQNAGCMSRNTVDFTVTTRFTAQVQSLAHKGFFRPEKGQGRASGMVDVIPRMFFVLFPFGFRL
jgi:hypothetical protein